jgi:biopolymer transport protein ExbB/TolQ
MGKFVELWNRLTRSPLLWGGALTIGFYTLIQAKYLDGEAVHRYFASHPVAYVSMSLFFVGMTTLFFKSISVLSQLKLFSKPLLSPAPADGESADMCRQHLAVLAKLPKEHQQDFLVARLRKALEHVQRRGGADGLDDELKYLAEADAAALHGSYSLMRIIIWAIPILGFLGTVMGITIAIANISPEALEESLPQVTGGLAVAFDTTALALALSMVLMFVQFLVDRAENRLLSNVDETVAAELAGRFQIVGAANDPQVAAVRRMADAVVQATERLVQRQAELWQATIEAAQQQWRQVTASTQQQVEAALTNSLTRSLKAHAQQIVESSQSVEERNRKHWDQIVHALTQSAETARSQQGELVRQGEVLTRVVEATGQVARLEETLNRNLAALSGSQNFEETLMSLAAAIQLLSARLGANGRPGPHVTLSKTRSEPSAA